MDLDSVSAFLKNGFPNLPARARRLTDATLGEAAWKNSLGRPTDVLFGICSVLGEMGEKNPTPNLPNPSFFHLISNSYLSRSPAPILPAPPGPLG